MRCLPDTFLRAYGLPHLLKFVQTPEIEVTVDDPKAYTRPWTVTLHQRLAVDAELVDEICLENERSAQRMK